MHILLGLLSAAAIILVIVRRLKQATDVARGAGEIARDAHGFFRGLAWKRQAGKNILNTVEDPREAAAALLVAIAQYPGAMTEAETDTIRSNMMATFEASAAQADELIAHGQWLTKGAGDIGSLFRMLASVIERTCDMHQKQELINMLRETAIHRAQSSDVPSHEINRLEQRLLPR